MCLLHALMLDIIRLGETGQRDQSVESTIEEHGAVVESEWQGSQGKQDPAVECRNSDQDTGLMDEATYYRLIK